MIGAIAGDIIGSPFEHHPKRSTRFAFFGPGARFTDDSVLSVAIADAILHQRPYETAVRDIGRRYPGCGYGGSFRNWLACEEPQPYNSWGNGSAMRVAPVGWAWDSEEEVLAQARLSAIFTHDHPEGIKGAQAVALAVLLARTTHDKHLIRSRISLAFGYDLKRRLEDIRPGYSFDVSCQGSVPESIIAFLESDSYEGAVRNAVSLGGDSDTQACIAGAIAEAYHGGVPPEIVAETSARLPADLLTVVDAFVQRFVER